MNKQNLRYPIRPSTRRERFRALFGFDHGQTDQLFLKDYTTLLLGQYHALPPTPVTPPTPDRLIEVNAVRKDADLRVELIEGRGQTDGQFELTWADLYRLELAIIKLEPNEALWSRLWILRNEYHEVASAQEREDYIKFKSASSDAKPTDEPAWAAVRADAVRLQEELNWRYVSLWTLEDFRGRLMRGLFWAAFIAICACLVAGWLLGKSGGSSDGPVNLLALVGCAGVAGAFVSAARRLHSAAAAGNTDLQLTSLGQGNLGVYLSPAQGGLFAWVFAAALGSGFVTSGVLPAMEEIDLCAELNCELLGDANVAKLLVWSFVAGFSERLVPDRIASLADEAGKPAKG